MLTNSWTTAELSMILHSDSDRWEKHRRKGKVLKGELAISEIHNKLLKNMDESKFTCSVFLDLAKVFDSVDHQYLLRKLEKYGIRGNALQLMTSYLSDRQHYVKLNNWI